MPSDMMMMNEIRQQIMDKYNNSYCSLYFMYIRAQKLTMVQEFDPNSFNGIVKTFLYSLAIPRAPGAVTM